MPKYAELIGNAHGRSENDRIAFYKSIKEVGTMEIKGIGGVFSAYRTAKTNVPKKFGFAAAINAAKAEIVNEVNADATPQEIVDAGRTAGDFSREELAALILMG